MQFITLAPLVVLQLFNQGKFAASLRRFLAKYALQMVSNFEEVLIKFDNSTKLLDKISEECQKYANLLLVNSKQSEDSGSCCNEMIGDIKQVRLLLKKLNYNKEQLLAIRAKDNKNEATNKRERVVKRNTRTSSMKYLVQWEKVVEEAQLAEGAPQSDEAEQPPLIPKPVIKRRMRQFENKDTKRASSTANFFLDEVDETPESHAEVLHEEEEETDSTHFKPRIVDVVVSDDHKAIIRRKCFSFIFSINYKYPTKKRYE